MSARQLRDATRELVLAHRTLDDLRRPCGSALTAPHAHALIELLQGGPMTVTALAERLWIDRSNVSRLCARMEEQGELLRSPDPMDGRALRLSLSPAGRRLAEAVDTASATHFGRLLKVLGPRAESVAEALRQLAFAMTQTTSTPPGDPRP